METFVYILKCQDGSFYTGITRNVNQRIARHQEGRGGRFTKTRRPVELLYTESYENHQKAAAREREIKNHDRRWKENLIARGSAVNRSDEVRE